MRPMDVCEVDFAVRSFLQLFGERVLRVEMVVDRVIRACSHVLVDGACWYRAIWNWSWYVVYVSCQRIVVRNLEEYSHP